MKVWKKNMVAAAVLVTVCAGIYVNWLYTEENAAASLMDVVDSEKVMFDETLILSEDMAAIAAGEAVNTTSTDYFAAVRLSRQKARDSAVNLLQDAMAYAASGEGTKDMESAMELEDIVRRVLTKCLQRCKAELALNSSITWNEIKEKIIDELKTKVTAEVTAGTFGS